MNYAEIKYYDIANGEGVRVSLFVSGCKIHCHNCFNKCTWDFNYGKPFDDKVKAEIIKALNNDYISGLTILGGEPFELENQKEVLDFIKLVREKCLGKTIWMFTGYLLDKDLKVGGKRYLKTTKEILENIDILVDGPFIEAKKNLRLKFRGSENQRIIDIPKTLKENKIILHKLNIIEEEILCQN